MKPFRFEAEREGLRKILVVELLGLGDNVHLLPALYQLRSALPQAQLHVMVRGHVADLFKLVPWVDRVWPYRVMPRKPGLAEHVEMVRALRAEAFDLALNSSGNDRSGWIVGLSGARIRLGRVPRKGRLLHWRAMHDQEIEAPYSAQATWKQKRDALAAAGVPQVEGPVFRVERPALGACDSRVRALDGRGYVHVSPFASEDKRGLPDGETAALITALMRELPDRPVVVSMGGSAREGRKWAAVRGALSTQPAQVFAGDIDTLSFMRLVSGASLHVGPDSGGVHVARMFGVPTVSWIRHHSGTAEWIADEPGSRAFVSRQEGPQGVSDIDGAVLARAAVECLQVRRP